MTEPRDPVDEWLSADVELLQPPPGTFTRIRRTARRRKAVRAMSTAAGAVVVVIAAAVTLPQLAAGLLPGHAGPEKVATGKSTSPISPHPSHPTVSPSRTQPASQGGGSALGSTGAVRRPAPGFQPTSVTFVGPSTGAVIGHADCPSGRCTSLAGTHDYGRTWFKVGAPPARPSNGAAGVSQIRFHDLTNGWAYGPDLYATHDGGLTWTKIKLPGRVIDLATVGSRAFAVVALGCSGAGQHGAANCASIALFSVPAQSDRWRLVQGASTGIAEAPGGLQLTGQHGYLMTKGLLYAGPVTAGPWHAVSNASPSEPPCLTNAGRVGPWLLAPTATTLFLACNSSQLGAIPPVDGALTLYRSDDQGLTWHRLGLVSAAGSATSLAVAPGSGWLVLATTGGIYYSTNQKSWHRASLAREPAGGFSDVGMTTTLQGVAVPANPSLHEIFTTSDGGLTWQARVIP